MVRRFPQPSQDRVFLEAFREGQATNPTPFGQYGQPFQNFIGGCPLVVEERAESLGETAPAGLAFVTLYAFLRPARFDDVAPCLTILKLLIIGTHFVWTNITRFGKSHRGSLGNVCHKFTSFGNRTQ